MGKKVLIIAEKPSVARDLARVLGKFNRCDGYFENEQYIVTWALGHLVTLVEPEDYDPIYKKWLIKTLPIIPDKFWLKANSSTLKQYKTIKKLANRSDVEQLINACDAGREGELIFRYIYRSIGCKKNFKRLWLSETTTEAVIKGFQSLRPGHEFDRLGYAAEARSRADWLIGINATRAFSVRHASLLSVGRVQTPTLAIIVNREREIRNFVVEDYWELFCTFQKENGQKYMGKWFNLEQEHFFKLKEAMAIKNKVEEQHANIVSIDQKDILEKAPLLFNLNDLQKEANKKFGFSAAKTLAVAQVLYETKKLITYPRTDSRYLTNELSKTIPQRLRALAGLDEYSWFISFIGKNNLSKRYINNSKVTDHTALIPTNVKPKLESLSSDEYKIYDMVVRRFLAAFFPPARYEQTRVVTEAAEETFITRGRVELDKGWKVVYEPVQEIKENDSEVIVPSLKKGETLQVVETEIQEKKTRPPKRFTEAGLLTVMEGAGRLLDDADLKEAMRGSGLGTPATRAAIIERLLKVKYIERKKRTLVPTSKGETLIDLVPELIKSPEMTARWEKALADIEEGNLEPGKFMDGIIEQTKKVVDLARKQETSTQVGNSAASNVESLGKCPLCGMAVVEYQRSYGCSGFRQGCQFVIWKKIAGKKITINQARILLEKGNTKKLKGFSSKSGKKFEAALVLKDGKVVFDFK
ncbi:DNA topoisomerase III [Desulfolucanica intricata]|uniref:DNA topoisomerase III n=1 Tax=Desulfolucanica intricata TaxID=1285191 RepID=UPI0008360A00|nr:DNA topoisomerase III [Desulfolucanica intricata]